MAKKKTLSRLRRPGVLIADAVRGRFFTVDEPEDPAVDGGPDLVERRVLVNPDRELRGNELFAEGKGGGMNRSPAAAGMHVFDDHRDAHRDEFARRFAVQLSQATVEFLDERGLSEVVVVASPRFLGMLRPELSAALSRSVEVVELAEELSALPGGEVHAQLAHHGVLRPREPGAGMYRPRGQSHAGGR